MKRLLLLLIILLVITTAVPIIAFANDAKYIKIDSDNVGFYLDSEDGFTHIFFLPQNTYALYISDVHKYYYSIEYNGINGRIKKSEVPNFPVSTYSNISKPFSDKIITLKEPNIIFRKDDLQQGLILLPTDTLLYIGQKEIDSVLYYAVKKNHETDIYFVRYNDISVEQTPTTPDPVQDPSPTEPDNNLIKILLIIGIIIPAVIMVFLLFKPRRRKPRSRRYVEDEPIYRRRDDDYYDDNDYY